MVHKTGRKKSDKNNGQTAVEFVMVLGVLVAIAILVKDNLTAGVASFIEKKVGAPLEGSASTGGKKQLKDYYSDSSIVVGGQ